LWRLRCVKGRGGLLAQELNRMEAALGRASGCLEEIAGLSLGAGGAPLAEDVSSDFRGLSPRKAVAFPAGAPPSRPDNSGSSAPTDEKCSFQLPFF
jgi:hypothetical protein